MKLSLRTLPRFLLTVVTTVLATLFVAPPIIFISLFTVSGTPTYVLMRRWAMMVNKGMGLTFSLHGAERIVPGTSYIITPNHQSNADILALVLTLPMPFRWVIKKELLKIPLFGWALGSTGAIALDRTDKSQAVKSLREGAGKLRNGWSVSDLPRKYQKLRRKTASFQEGSFHAGGPDGNNYFAGHVQRGFPGHAKEIPYDSTGSHHRHRGRTHPLPGKDRNGCSGTYGENPA